MHKPLQPGEIYDEMGNPTTRAANCLKYPEIEGIRSGIVPSRKRMAHVIGCETCGRIAETNQSRLDMFEGIRFSWQEKEEDDDTDCPVLVP